MGERVRIQDTVVTAAACDDFNVNKQDNPPSNWVLGLGTRPIKYNKHRSISFRIYSVYIYETSYEIKQEQVHTLTI